MAPSTTSQPPLTAAPPTSRTTHQTTLAPDQLLALVRVLWLVACSVLALPTLLDWAEIELTVHVSVLSIARWITLIGCVVILLELLHAAVTLLGWSRQLINAPSKALRIRTPNPQMSIGTLGENAPDGADLWYAAHRLFPEHHGSGVAPWLAMILSAAPDEPVQFGAVVGGGEETQHTSWVDALRQIIIGHNAEAVVDSPEDRLALAIERATGVPGAVLAWAEYLLPHNAGYPLRIPEDASADLLGPLAAQIRPRAGKVRFAEAQLITQPRHDWRSDGLGWRSAAHRRLQAMKARAQGGYLMRDGRALERKLNDPADSAVVRIVLVAESTAEATRMLREVGAVFGQYAERSGQLLQRFVHAGQGMVELSTPASATRSRPRPIALTASLAIGIILAIVAWYWPTGLIPLLPLPGTAYSMMQILFSGCWLLAPILVFLAHTNIIRRVHQQYWCTRLIKRAPRLVPPLPLLIPLSAWWPPAILSAGELGGIWHLPSPNLGNLARWLPSRHLPASPLAFIRMPSLTTPTGQQSRRITIGHAVRSDGQLAPVGPSLYDLRNIGHLTAGMGAGKSRFFANLCKQLMSEGFTLIDGKGDDAGNLTATVRQYIARDDERRVVLLDITDTDWPIGVNPLAGIEIDSPGAIDRVTAQIQSIFARLDPEGWSAAPGMQQFLDMGTRLVVETEALPTVAHVKQALIDETYRNQLLSRCTKLEVKTFWQVIYPTSSEQQKTSMNALMRRFDKLLLSDLVRALMTQERPTFRFRDAIADRLLVLCPIPHVTYGPLAATAAMLLFQSFLRAAFERPGSAVTRRDYPLIVDEFQVMVEHGATQDVATAVTQLRSLGIPTLYAHQAMTQVGDLRDLLLINAENRILMRTQEPDASMYARQYGAAGLTGADIASQEPTEHQYARFVVGGQLVGPISMVPLPWPKALTIMEESYTGSDWQSIIPNRYLRALPGPVDTIAANMAQDYDQLLLSLIYDTPYSDGLALRLADLSDEEWYLLNSRWEAIAHTQRQYIIDNPGCIPDRDERVRWLSRLGFARPRILAEAEFLRIRNAMGLDGVVAGTKKKDKKGGARSTHAEPREHYSTNANEPPVQPYPSTTVAPEEAG